MVCGREETGRDDEALPVGGWVKSGMATDGAAKIDGDGLTLCRGITEAISKGNRRWRQKDAGPGHG